MAYFHLQVINGEKSASSVEPHYPVAKHKTPLRRRTLGRLPRVGTDSVCFFGRPRLFTHAPNCLEMLPYRTGALNWERNPSWHSSLPSVGLWRLEKPQGPFSLACASWR